MRNLWLLVAAVFTATMVHGQPLPPAGGPPKPPPGTILIRPRPQTDPTLLPPPTASVPSTTTILPAPTVVSRPTGPVIFGSDPTRPGFLVVRPQPQVPQGTGFTPGTTAAPETAAAPVVSEALPGPRDTNVPHLVIIRPAQPTGAPASPANPARVDPPAQPAGQQPTDGKILFETWDVSSARGCKLGYMHIVAREFERDGKKLIYATRELKLKLARFGQAVEQWREDATIETPEGQVLATVMRQGIGKNQMLVIRGEVVGKKLKVTIDMEGAAKHAKEIDWPDGVIGISREASIVKDKKLRPGESIGYSVFDSGLTSVVKYTASAVKLEEVAAGGKARSLLQVRMEMTPIGDFKLPPGMVWFDPETYEQIKTEQEMPMFGGLMTVQRTTREVATRPAAKLLDLADVQSIVLANEIRDAHTAEEIVYRITLAGDLPIEKAFRADRRQSINNIDEKTRTFDLTVTAQRRPAPAAAPAVRPGKEFLSDCYFVDWDNEAVKQHARAAVVGLPANADNWRKAQAVEAYVNKSMKPAEFSQAMATCSNVAKTLSGDCTEYSVFAAGICRALDIPSRTAIGLVYAPPQRGVEKATLAWHMWFEVWVDGEWLPLDAILGAGSIGAAHLKVTDASWHDEKAFTPLVPLLNLLGASPRVEVREVKPRK